MSAAEHDALDARARGAAIAASVAASLGPDPRELRTEGAWDVVRSEREIAVTRLTCDPVVLVQPASGEGAQADAELVARVIASALAALSHCAECGVLVEGGIECCVDCAAERVRAREGRSACRSARRALRSSADVKGGVA